ncbi:MAG: diguanylate cyclase [Butyrivibrio sp.]|nr:diguanylate cyclase [Butyrivibrio sp.]
MEEKKPLSRNFVYGIIFGVIVIAIALYALLFTDVFKQTYQRRLLGFSDTWESDDGNLYSVNDVTVSDFDGSLHLSKKLPLYLTDRDSICFTSRNVDLRLVVDGEEIYRYETVRNITGMGYGDNVHEVGLSEGLAGKTIEIFMNSVSEQNIFGYINDIYIGTAADYVHFSFETHAMQFILTMLIIFIGLVMILVWAGVPDKNSLPIDVLSMGVGAVLVGIWLLAGSSSMQLLTGRVYCWRVLNRACIFLVLYPFVRFFNSITRLHRSIYNTIAFYVSVSLVAIMAALWLIAGIDTASSDTILDMFLIGFSILIITVIFVDNYYFCKRNNMQIEHKGIYFGLGIFLLFCLAELAVYVANLRYVFPFGTFTRIGMLLFIVIVLLQFLKWWMKDHAAVNRDRFINRSLQFSVGSKSPDESIRLLLEYLGTELGATRAYIFEDKGDGNFVNSYEWQLDEMEPRPRELSSMPYRGCIDRVLESLAQRDNCVVVEDAEEIKNISPILYERMGKIGAKSIVAGPLMSKEKLVGIIGINDVASEHIRETTQIMGVVSFFFTQFISQKQEQDRMLYYSYHDPLSGARNRSAMKEFTEEKFDMSQSFGYVLCEIDGLKEINDSIGHDAGDDLVNNTAKCMIEAFGEENVYRLSGEEFVAFGFESDETYFDNDVDRVRRLLRERGCRVSIGAVYCSNGATNLKNVQKYAKSLLEKEQIFYDSETEAY